MGSVLTGKWYQHWHQYLMLSTAIAFGIFLDGAMAQENEAYFAKLDLDTSQTSTDSYVVQGEMGGTFSLTAISQYDDAGNLCSGYSYDEAVPNHILRLSKAVDHLRVWVDSDGQDTTLLIQGPNSIDCGDDISRANPDAEISRNAWRAGVYKVWVGTSTPNMNASKSDRDYELNVQVQPEP